MKQQHGWRMMAGRHLFFHMFIVHLIYGFNDEIYKHFHLHFPQPRVLLLLRAIAPNIAASFECQSAEAHPFLYSFLFHERRAPPKVYVCRQNIASHTLRTVMLPALHLPGNVHSPQRQSHSQAPMRQWQSGTCAAGPPLRRVDDVI